MSADDNKQVQDALLAIKKLVEMSEDKISTSDDVLTLDNVVWRNPVGDAQEEGSDSAASQSAKTPEAGKSNERKAPDAKTQTPIVTDTAPQPNRTAPLASLSVSSRDLDKIAAESKRRHTQQSQPDAETRLPDSALPNRAIPDTHQAPVSDIPSPPPETNAHTASSVGADDGDDITDLTMPLGRRGGGFYSEPAGPKDALPQPSIVTKTRPIKPNASDAPAASTSPTHNDKAREVNVRPQVAIKSLPQQPEPALTDFHGADFNFSAAEGLITALSFTELEKPLTRPITPEVDVPIAPPAVEDPVAQVQAMYDTPDDALFEADALYSSSGQPNLHVVSDQSQDTSDDDNESDGFSGDVRLALRAIIKEQVSTWLQGNMTDLIEEALTTPQKRPSAPSKPSSKKR